jgi:hypothetical protein
MCQLCETKSVYEFTNKRKLCSRCFVNYFQKKFLYILRKFGLIKSGDIIGYKKENTLNGVVLESLLQLASQKYGFALVSVPNKKANKIASNSSIDSESEDIVNIIINKNSIELENYLPIEKNIIKPLYLFLDEEILIYAKLKKLNFKIVKERKNKIKEFLDKSKEKHPEIKRAVVNSLLKLYGKD